MMSNIDLVVPYVDCSDPEWIELFKEYSPKTNNTEVDAKNRFRGNDELFKYFFRCVEQNLPWINNIFLLVQSYSQVPHWVNTEKVKVITHNQFIPDKFLPTFSSSAIEMFLWNIPGLSEQFLYANDDFFILNKTNPEDWFGKDGKVKFACKFMKNTEPDNLYFNLLASNVNVITPGIPDICFSIYHTFRPYYKSRMRECYYKYQDKIDANITRFRALNNNNCYLFSYYDYLKKFQENSSVTYGYCSFKRPGHCLNAIETKKFDCIVINDEEENMNKNVFKGVLSAFNKHFPEKSVYENSGDEPAVKRVEEEVDNKMKPCFGIVSYFPWEQPERKQRQDRLDRLIKQLSDFWPDVPIIVIAQQWKNYNLDGKCKNQVIRFNYEKLGILRARQELRRRFLELGYDYLIMFDDDAIIKCDSPDLPKKYMEELEKHPGGFCFIDGKGSSDYTTYNDSQLNLNAISRSLYEKEPIPNIDPQKSEAFEDRIWSTLLHFKYSELEFKAPAGIMCVHFKNPTEIVPSTWAQEKSYNWKKMRSQTKEIEAYIAEHKDLPKWLAK